MNLYTMLMSAAKDRCQVLGAASPALSPLDATLLTREPKVDVAALHALGIRIIPWTTNDLATMRALIALGIDGLITDRPDLLKQIPELAVNFDLQGHRGARGLRPENTLPAFEAGLDHLVTTLETDTGVTRDLQSILWHDQYLNPEFCRRRDGQPYTLADAWYHRDHTLGEIQSTFVCDIPNSRRFPDQRNDHTLSPVSTAFSEQEARPGLYCPVATAELFRFTHFYADYYRIGPGRIHPQAEARALNATTVRFNLETKILPYPDGGHTPPSNTEDSTNHTVSPETFVTILCATIAQAHMQARCTIQSFDFRTLELVQEQHPAIPTIYLTE